MFVSTRFLPNKHDPWKEPAWRWARAGYLIRHGFLPFWSLDDALTGTVLKFRKALEGCRDGLELAAVHRRYPALAEAHAIHFKLTELRQAEVQARVLANEASASIAARCGFSAEGVEAYHAIFFEVRPHLQAEFYIIHSVIGEGVECGLNLEKPAALVKWFGYSWGSDAVDLLLDDFVNPPVVPADLAALKDHELERLVPVREVGQGP